MSYLSIKAKKENTYDAIVIGSGISGGWAAKELSEHGLKTLVLERGRDVQHIKDYPTANKHPWEFEFRGKMPIEISKQYGSRGNRLHESTAHFFLKDNEHPYKEVKPFRWVRGYQVGGKSLLWARQTQRWSDFDFEGPARDGYAVDWPIRYADLAPWYSHVEKFAGISGNKDGVPELPDGEFLPPVDLSCVERHFQSEVSKNYTDRRVLKGRCAHVTDPQPIHLEQGRSKCMHRTLCNRGCPLGGYFSSNASTLPWAAKTGNMTMRPHSVAHSIIFDKEKNKATGVRVVDSRTMEMMEFYAKVIFVNGSALNSNLVLMNSVSDRFPNGLGNDNGLLGKYLTWHNFRGRVTARYDGYQDMVTDGRNPTHAYIPRFRNLRKQETDFLRGYAAGFSGNRGTLKSSEGIGETLKENLLNNTPGDWHLSSWMMGEVVPLESNFLSLDANEKDPFGIPILNISADWSENDEKMLKDYQEQLSDMFAKAGFTDIKAIDNGSAPGADVHEMGGVRMGKDPKTSLLNKWNQMHLCQNVFVTDGACMTSSATQNPSLTYMAITARAANHAVDELKKGNL